MFQSLVKDWSQNFEKFSRPVFSVQKLISKNLLSSVILLRNLAYYLSESGYKALKETEG